MKAVKATLVIGVVCLGLWAMMSSVMQAETEPAPQAAPTAEQQATAIVGQAVQGFLLYAPTTEAQRKLAIDSYNTVKTAIDEMAQPLEAPKE